MKKNNSFKVLIPVDFSKTSLKAIKHGAFIAKINKGDVLLLNVQKKTDLVDVIFPAFKLKDLSVVTNYLNEKLQNLATEVKKEFKITVDTLVTLGNVTSEIVSIAEENNVNYIVMGTQGGDSQSSIFLGSNAYRVISKATCPVMTIRANSSEIGYKNIVMPIDSSEHTLQKIIPTLEFAENFASKILLLGLVKKDDKDFEITLNNNLKQIEKYIKKYKFAVNTTLLKTDNPSHSIIKFATKNKANLISIMSDQEGGASKLLGQFSHHIINDSKIPVLTFKPFNTGSGLSDFGMGGMS
jgi:nucleotide-binding universal stress UspA family protein